MHLGRGERREAPVLSRARLVVLPSSSKRGARLAIVLGASGRSNKWMQERAGGPTNGCRHHRNGVGLRGGWRSGVVLTLLPLLSAPCLKSSGEEDVYGPIRWTGRARGDVYVGGGGTIGPAPDVEGCRDERSSSGGSNPKYPGSGESLLGGRNAERVAARDPRAGGVGDRGRVAAGDEGSEGRPSRRLVAGGGAAGGSDPHAGVQGAEALGGIAKRGDDVPDGHPGRGEGEEPPEGGLAWTRDPGRRWGLRREEAREVAEGAADVGASTDGGVAGTGARPTGSAARGGGRLAAQGSEGASHHQAVVDRAGVGPASDGTVGGGRDHPTPVSDSTTVLELLWAGGRDAVIVGLGTRDEWEVDSSGSSTDPRAESEAAAGAEDRLQGCGHDGDHAAPRASSSYGLRADAAVGHQTEPGQAHTGPSHRRNRAVDVEARGGVRPGTLQD